MGLAISKNNIDKYLGFLSKLDTRSKKNLIIKLTESIDENKSFKVSLNDLYGAWEDSRDSDEIIKEIKNSRIEKTDNPEF